MNLLKVDQLSICFDGRDGTITAVDQLSFSVARGESLGIVGESGSGKSVTCLALLQLITMPPGRISGGSAHFDGIDLLRADTKSIRKIRGKRISMIFQDPMTALNPYLRIGQQLVEPLQLHNKISGAAAKSRAVALLKEVGIDNAEERFSQYPHEFSGGMRQRVVIAMALITEPELLIADEPTTALDVTIQAQILSLINRLKQQRNLAIIFISHDLDVIRKMTQRVVVMKKGRGIEQGNTADVFQSPRADYTKRLLASIPHSSKPGHYHFATAKPQPLLSIDRLTIDYPVKGGRFIAVNNVSLTVNQGEVLGLVGESGCGKTSLSQSIVRLVNSRSGSIQLRQKPLQKIRGRALKSLRREVQIIFQDPYASLNPRMTVFNTLAEPITLHGLTSSHHALREKVLTLMEQVGLDQRWANKYPHEFSGGQRQRIAIARALAVEPQLIIADEPVSALDVTIQAQILQLLLDLCQRLNLTLLFISHDLAVVRYIADRTAVMQAGRIVEIGDTETLYNAPQHPYTQQLLDSRL